ncbi:MAG: threonine synthase, partial [Candidatus Gracilibacteria bacterium]
MTKVQYVDTRGIDPRILTACEVVLEGTTSSKGLWVPRKIPKFSDEQILALRDGSFIDVMVAFLDEFGFIGKDAIPLNDAVKLVIEAYENFLHDDILNLRPIDGQGNFILDLCFGPTMSFKDYALALLGKIIPYLLKRKGMRGIVLGATSGDTGPAGMANVASEDMFVYIIYPDGRTSIGQEQQMIYLSGKIAQAFAMKGLTFDDSQFLAKGCFNDQKFLDKLEQKGIKLISINSINWLRIMAQTAYMFHVSMKPVFSKGTFPSTPNFVIPSANSGHWLGAWIAKQMGANIGNIVLALNQNNILERVINTGKHEPSGVIPTLAPAMDIDISSNFERVLYFIYGSGYTSDCMVRDQGVFTILPELFMELKNEISAYSVSDDEIRKQIKEIYERLGIIIDPHTATAFAFPEKCKDYSGNNVFVSTAHPMKFMDTITEVLGP